MSPTLKRQSTETPNIRYVFLRTLNGSVEDVFDPKFRKFDYCSVPTVVLVSTHLRCAWRALRDIFKEEREGIPQNLGRESLHTPWRDSIYRLWNHIFHVVMNFFPAINCSVGYLHPPSHDAFTLDYPIPEVGNVAVGKKGCSTNVLLIPAHRRPGVTIRATVNDSHEAGTLEKELGRFDA